MKLTSHRVSVWADLYENYENIMPLPSQSPDPNPSATVFFLVHALISVIQDELLRQKTKCMHSTIIPHFNFAFKLRSELDDPAKCAHHFHLVILR